MREEPDHPDRRAPNISKAAKAGLLVVFALSAVIAALLLFTGVIAGDGDDEARRGRDGIEQKWTDFEDPPWTEGIEVGRTYEYSVNAHCGVHVARIDGTNWRADPVIDDGMGNPPRGWEVLSGVGSLRILDGDTALFTNGGRSVRFVRDQLPDPPPCA